MQITGEIVKIFPTELVGQKQTEKQKIQITETTGEYPNSMIIDVFGKKIPELNGFKLGDIVTVSYNTRVTESKDGRLFNNISLWNIEKTKDKQEESDLPF